MFQYVQSPNGPRTKSSEVKFVQLEMLCKGPLFHREPSSKTFESAYCWSDYFWFVHLHLQEPCHCWSRTGLRMIAEEITRPSCELTRESYTVMFSPIKQIAFESSWMQYLSIGDITVFIMKEMDVSFCPVATFFDCQTFTWYIYLHSISTRHNS
jgi:hypothetical protein